MLAGTLVMPFAKLSRGLSDAERQMATDIEDRLVLAAECGCLPDVCWVWPDRGPEAIDRHRTRCGCRGA